VIPGISALLSAYTVPGEEGSVFGLDNSIRAGARSIAPLLGSGVALLFGMRGTFVATGVILLLASALAAWRLPRPKAGARVPSTQTETRTW
jgi:DHA1 family multidrug resistance protein-like MFS transporter